MDRNVALAVFFLFSIVADVALAAKFRHLAGDPPQNNQVSGKNKQDPNLDGAVKKPENVQASSNSPPLDQKPFNKTNLVSPTYVKQTSDHSKNLDLPSSGRLPVENQTVSNEETQKIVETLESPYSVKNNVASTDLLSPSSVKKNVTGTDLLSPSSVKNTVASTDLLSPSSVKKNVTGTDLLSPSSVKNDVTGTDLLSPSSVKNNVTGTDLLSPSPVKRGLNGTDLFGSPVNATDNGNDGRVKEKIPGDKSKETGNGKDGGAKENTIDDKSKDTNNGKSGRVEEKTIDDKSNEKNNEKNSEVKEKTEEGKDNGKISGVKDKTIDDKSGKTDNEKIAGDNRTNGKVSSELGVKETCEGLPTCTDLNTMIACIQSFDSGSGELTVLVKNGGENNLMVNLTLRTASENPLELLKISKHQTQKISISLSTSKNTKLTLNAGNGECVLHTDRSEPKENPFIYLPSYDKLLTPINGAYFLILSVLIFGGTWACCKCRKRRWNDGVPYQELEMALPESVPAADLETAEGWDQGWDDDWDENTAVKSPGASRIGSISANGLTSRSPNRDGWEHGWDE